MPGKNLPLRIAKFLKPRNPRLLTSRRHGQRQIVVDQLAPAHHHDGQIIRWSITIPMNQFGHNSWVWQPPLWDHRQSKSIDAVRVDWRQVADEGSVCRTPAWIVEVVAMARVGAVPADTTLLWLESGRTMWPEYGLRHVDQWEAVKYFIVRQIVPKTETGSRLLGRKKTGNRKLTDRPVCAWPVAPLRHWR